MALLMALSSLLSFKEGEIALPAVIAK